MTRWRLSLSLKTTLALVFVNLVAAGLVFLQFYLTFWDNIFPHFDHEHLASIKQFLDYRPGEAVPAPDVVALLEKHRLRFVVFDDAGRILSASAGIDAPFFPQSHSRFNELFRNTIALSKPGLYGFSNHSNGVTVQLATTDPVLFYEAMIHRLAQHLTLISAVFLMVTLGANALVLRWSLRPIRRVSEDAAAIGPQTTSRRLSEHGLPTEILPLVRAVNLVLDRLEEGYIAQRNFIADAAHELRTPLAVLKAHLDVLDDRQIARSLEDDLAGMERLVSQLLAMARLEGIRITDDAAVDLSSLAVDVVRHLGPIAFDMNRDIEVVGGEQPIRVKGNPDCLFRALRNLVENALRHGPAHSTVTVRLNSSPPAIGVEDHGPGIPLEAREFIFQRFWRGGRDRNSEDGAGLGLAIVAATMRLHGGDVEIGDTLGGGATFVLRFPETSFSRDKVNGEGG